MTITSRGLLFCQLGVATGEVVGNIDARLYRDDHVRCQHSISVHSESIVGVHAKVVAHMVGVETIHGLCGGSTTSSPVDLIGRSGSPGKAALPRVCLK